MMEKKSRKDKTSPAPDSFSATEVGVLIEDLRSNFRSVSDGLVTLREKVDGLEIKVDDLSTRMEKVEITTEKILVDTTQIKKVLFLHENRITKLEEVSS